MAVVAVAAAAVFIFPLSDADKSVAERCAINADLIVTRRIEM